MTAVGLWKENLGNVAGSLGPTFPFWHFPFSYKGEGISSMHVC